MSKIKKLLNSDDTVLVFDIDGVLALLEFGEYNHYYLDDDAWDKATNDGINYYDELKVSKRMQEFLKNKNMNNIKYYLDRVAEIFAEEQFVFEPHELYEPIDYTLRLGGKRIRPTLLLAANALFGGKEEEVRNAALGIETFHNFTLLHDDLMDRSPLRRGQPTVYTKWGDNPPSSAATPCSPSPGATSCDSRRHACSRYCSASTRLPSRCVKDSRKT